MFPDVFSLVFSLVREVREKAFSLSDLLKEMELFAAFGLITPVRQGLSKDMTACAFLCALLYEKMYEMYELVRLLFYIGVDPDFPSLSQRKEMELDAVLMKDAKYANAIALLESAYHDRSLFDRLYLQYRLDSIREELQ